MGFELLLLLGATAAVYFLTSRQALAAIGGAGVTVEPMGSGFSSSPAYSSPAWSTAPFSSSPAYSSPWWTAAPAPSPSMMTSATPAPIGGGSPAVLLPMRVSPDGRAFIKSKEGLRLRAYPDAGFNSIGYGHQLRPGETYPNGITAGQAESLFAADIAAVEQTLNASVNAELSQGQFDALASLVYNIGAPRFLSSTLLRQLNAGDYAGAAAQFPAWNKSGGSVNPVLVARRADEQQLFATV